MKKLALLVCIILFSACAPRHLPEPGGNVATVSSRLSNPDITCFMQEPSGRMWIGTERGLNRYNGYDFHQFIHGADSSSLHDNRIYDICLDRENRVWAGTEDGVAVYEDGAGFRRVPINSDEKAVWQIILDRNGKIILNMLEDLCVYDSLSCRFEPALIGFDRFYNYRSRCHIGPDGMLWVVTPSEIRCFETDGFQNVDNIPTLHSVTESLMLPNGEIWMAGRGRVSIFNIRTFAFRSASGNLLKALSGHEVELFFHWDRSRILLKTSDGVFHFYNTETDVCEGVSPQYFSLPQGFDTKTLFKDSRGNIWFGSDDKGFRCWPHMGESGPVPHALDGKSVVSMSLAGDGNLWLMTRHDGPFIYDTKDGTISRPDISAVKGEDHTDYLQSNQPLVFASSSGDIWLVFANQQRIVQCRYSGGRLYKKNEYPAFYPKVAVEDKDGGIWFGTRNECLLYIAPGGNQAERIQIYPYQTTFIHCLLPLEDKILVGAYDEPMKLIDIHTREIRNLDMAGADWERCIGTDFFYPTAFLQDSGGDIWIGTRFNGVLRYSPSRKSLNPVPGAPGADIAILEKDLHGRIWVGTADGLARYDAGKAAFTDIIPPQDGGGTFFYDRASKLLPNGTLVMGSSDGIRLVNPEGSPAPATFPLVFDDVVAHGKSVFSGGSKVTLGYGDNSFSVSFSASDYENLSRIHYVYKLEGYDRDWVEAGTSREVYFANVPPGRYKLKVRYHLLPDRNSFMEGVMQIRVLPAPWRSWWAWTLYILAFLSAVVTGLRAKNRMDKERAAVKEARRNIAFFSNISHEFRTPLTMISGPVSELSRSSGISDKDRNLLDIVRRSADRMLSLVNQLMDFGKLESASLSLRVAKGDIVPVLLESMEIYRANAESLGLVLDLKGMEYPLVTWFDEDKVRKIIGNLLSNAVKFTPRGGAVTMELDQVIRGGEPWIKITVTDTGEGIPEDKTEKIFERYYQLDRKGGHSSGTGIGLYYARSLALMHHGELKASNRTEGSGAVFSFMIPMREDAYTDAERIPMEEPSVSGEYPMETLPGPVPRAGDDARPVLLAVDDDPDILRYLTALFSAGYSVITASSADEALKKALDNAPDVVLSDVAMPGKDGFDLCRTLKSNLQLSHVPVILVTAMGTVKNQVRGLEEGADAYVTKPFDPAYLKALVKSQLENRRRVQKLLNAATDSSEVEDTLSSRDKAFLDGLYSLMERELSNEDLDISRLTDMLKISRTKFYYKIKGLTGKTPSEFFMQYKLNVAAKLLKEGVMNVSEIAIKTGFSTLPHFSKAFKKQFGVPPSKYTG
ncbi:MAG: response regulator [Bacteroidales bacterium]|nr:response regulator [Bacteroidales bacterium]